MLFDSHAHLDDRRFDGDRKEVIKKIKDSGLSYVINAGADLPSTLHSIRLAHEYDFIYASVGVHPHDAKSMDEETLSILEGLAKKPKVVAIGEIGLDYHYDNSPREVQRKWFREQLKLAKSLDMPIIIHDREAHGDILQIVKEEKWSSMRGVFHCFSGSLEMARECIKMGFYISIAGPITYKNARKTVEVVKELPLEKLLIETDSPYLTPEPFRGRRNDPSYVRLVAEKIAEIKGISFEEVASETLKNAKALFNIP